MIIDCKSIALDIKDKIKNIIKKEDCIPVLHIYQVGIIQRPTLIFVVNCVTVKMLVLKQSLSSCQKILLKMN